MRSETMKNHRHAASSYAIAVAIAASFTVAGTATAQTDQARRTQPTAKPSQIPRLPDGRPDLQGVWNFASATPLQRPAQFADKPVLTDAEAAAYLKNLPKDGCRLVKCDGSDRSKLESAYDEAWWDQGSQLAENRTSLIVDPPDGKIPQLTPAAQKKIAENIKADRGRAPLDGPEGATVTDRCILGFNSGPPMNPSAYNNMVQITQSKGFVVIFNEMIHNSRIVPLDGRPHVPSTLRQWAGDSRGHWEGDTLVIDTTNFSTKSDFMGSHENLHLTERISRADADTLDYEFTIDDPKTWTAPWTAMVPMKLKNEMIFEYACHEGNDAIPYMLRGHRFEEREAAAKTRSKQ